MALVQADAALLVRILWALFPEDLSGLANALHKLAVQWPTPTWVATMKTEIATRPTVGLSVAWAQNELQRYYDAGV